MLCRHSGDPSPSFPRRRESIFLNHDCHDLEMIAMMLPRTSSPLDSGFRRNDVGRVNDVGGVGVHNGNHGSTHSPLRGA